jgi:hypothetical protein
MRKVFRPAVTARVKKDHDLAGQRVDPGKVWALVGIAELAGEGKVMELVPTAVLAGDDVLDVKSQPPPARFARAAILAAIAGPLPDLFARGLIHHAAACVFR